jgi:hypothetical protein
MIGTADTEETNKTQIMPVELYHQIPPDPPGSPVKNFYIEAVIVCREYDDFLRSTLPHNKQLFDRVVVVTSPEDKKTQKLCEFYHVECVQTDALGTKQKKFCKGAGVNEGLARLSKKGWVLHLDADIWLPPQTRILLEQAQLDEKMIYGIDRFNVRGYSKWEKFLKRPVLQHECGSYIHLDNSFPVGTRVMQSHMHGYVPIGFFQLWCPAVSGINKYIEGHADAGKEDILFSWQWPRASRGFIPEIVAYHLESEDSGFGKNWAGRKTSQFEHVSWIRKILRWFTK